MIIDDKLAQIKTIIDAAAGAADEYSKASQDTPELSGPETTKKKARRGQGSSIKWKNPRMKVRRESPRLNTVPAGVKPVMVFGQLIDPKRLRSRPKASIVEQASQIRSELSGEGETVPSEVSQT